MDLISNTEALEFSFPEYELNVIFEEGIWRISPIYEDQDLDDLILEDKKNNIIFAEDVEVFGNGFIITVDQFKKFKEIAGDL